MLRIQKAAGRRGYSHSQDASGGVADTIKKVKHF